MATTSPDNLFSPDASSQYALTTDLATMQSTVQSALNSRANFYRGTSTQRTALSTAGQAQNGTYWADTNGTQRLYRYNGTAWVDQAISDSGWQTLTLSGGFTGSAQYRKVGDDVEVKFDVSGSISGDTQLTAAMPAGFYRGSNEITPGTIYADPAGARGPSQVYLSQSAGTVRAGSTVTASRIRGMIRFMI